MTALDVLLGARALERGSAVRRAQLRHFHLEEEPMLLSVLKFGGERFRPSAIMFTPARASSDLRATYVYDHQDTEHFLLQLSYFATSLKQALDGGRQIVVPNGATIRALRTIGRGLVAVKYRTDFTRGEHRAVLNAGQYLMQLSDHARVTGQSALLPLAETVVRHWATIAAPFERADLAVVEAQIEPPAGLSAFDAAAAARADRFTTGPNMHAALEDALTLARRGERSLYDRVREDIEEAREFDAELDDTGATRAFAAALREQLERTRRLMMSAIARERRVPEAPASLDRWAEDVRAVRRFVKTTEDDSKTFFVRDSPLDAARKLHDRERAKALYEARSAFDDPLLMVSRVLEEKALVGVVEAAFTEPAGAGCVVGTVRLRCDWPIPFEDDTRLAFGYGGGHGEWSITSAADGDTYTAELRSTKRAREVSLPEVGDRSYWMPPEPMTIRPPLPQSIPWTHRREHPDAESPLDGGDERAELSDGAHFEDVSEEDE